MGDSVNSLNAWLARVVSMGDEFSAWAGLHPFWGGVFGVLALFALAGVCHLLLRHLVVRLVQGLVRRSDARWDDALVQAGVFRRAALSIPILVVFQGAPLVPALPSDVSNFVRRLALAAFIAMLVAVASAALRAFGRVYASDPSLGRRSIKSYIQILEIGAMAAAAILILAVLLNRSPMVFLGGLGAMTAVLILVFKDTILGFVASLQIAGNDMLRVGDWIEMPSAGADGDVVDIALHTIKVQNFDMTITTIPTYLLIEQSFKNWRGMSESGGRRIKRALWFDVNTVRFLDEEEMERFSTDAILCEYMAQKKEEIEGFNQRPSADPRIRAGMRRLTNIGTMRAYIENYLRNHEMVHDDMTLLVRQLQSTSEGLPVEIYCFTTTTKWGAYEAIQADIFDHILAVVPEFGLRIFQRESDFVSGTNSS